MSRSLTLLPLTCLAAALMTGLFACTRPRTAAVRVSIPGADSAETPAAGVGVIALPYDRDSLLRALAAKARRPRPSTAALDSLFRSFRGPFAAYARTSALLAAIRDSLASASPGDSTRLTHALSSAESANERARRALDAARAGYVERSDSLRTLVRRWEDSTYQGYDSLVDVLARRRGAEPATDTTDATGWAHFTLSDGPWWFYARSWDASDPNAEWYWNVPATGDTVALSSRSGRLQPRY